MLYAFQFFANFQSTVRDRERFKNQPEEFFTFPMKTELQEKTEERRDESKEYVCVCVCVCVRGRESLQR